MIALVPNTGAVGVIGQFMSASQEGRETEFKVGCLRPKMDRNTFNRVIEIITESPYILHNLKIINVQLSGIEMKTLENTGVHVIAKKQELLVENEKMYNCIVIGCKYFNLLKVSMWGLQNPHIKTIVVNPNRFCADRRHYRAIDVNILREAKYRGLSRYCEDLIEII